MTNIEDEMVDEKLIKESFADFCKRNESFLCGQSVKSLLADYDTNVFTKESFQEIVKMIETNWKTTEFQTAIVFPPFEIPMRVEPLENKKINYEFYKEMPLGFESRDEE